MKGDRILLVDDEREVTDAVMRELRSLCQEQGLTMTAATSAGEALEKLADEGDGGYAVMLSDLKMPGMKGTDLLRVVAERWPDTVCIVLTGNAELENIQDFLKAGLFSYIQKPWDRGSLVLDILRALEVHDLKRRDREHRSALEREISLALEFHKRLTSSPVLHDDRLLIDIYKSNAPGLGFGGDFVDVRRLDANRIMVVLADVSGHGLAASFVVALIKSIMDVDLLPSFSSLPLSPASFAQWLNSKMCNYLSNMGSLFVALLVMEIDLECGKCTWVNAGQPPFALNSGAGATLVSTPQLPVGVNAATRYREESCMLALRGQMLLTTDGCFPSGIEIPGFDRKAFADIASASLSEGIEARSIVERLQARMGSELHADDITVLRIERLA